MPLNNSQNKILIVPFLATVYRYEKADGSTIPGFDAPAPESGDYKYDFACGYLNTAPFDGMVKTLNKMGMFLVQYQDVEIVEILPFQKVIFKRNL